MMWAEKIAHCCARRRWAADEHTAALIGTTLTRFRKMKARNRFRRCLVASAQRATSDGQETREKSGALLPVAGGQRKPYN